ncbi:MAG: hypothetical protein ACR2JV_08365, partial [Gaiellales bacterium]
LTMEARTIVRRLGERMAGDGPAAIKVEIGPISVPPEAVATPPIDVSPEARRLAEERSADVDDPRLRAALSHAIAVTLSRPKTP